LQPALDKQIYFLDRYVFYQFSSDECTYLFCEYEGEKGWINGVKFLLKMVPVTSPRINIVMSWDCGFKYLFPFPPTLKTGVMCKIQEREDIGHIELVQKFAKENCHVPQANKREPVNTDQTSQLGTFQIDVFPADWEGARMKKSFLELFRLIDKK
uniref:Uncharacterized protein n=1 Tax=Laticauda laticaudata TaxID=8630 RepID=A0A8C5SL24_LATLA